MPNECPKCQTNNPYDSKFCKECGTSFTDSDQPIPTKTLETPVEEMTTGSTFSGRYQIIEQLGKGGMGRVYKVLDKETNEKIALKLIKPEIASDKKTIERFRNELTTTRKIVQKNICRMYDLNREKDNYYITMEFISGGDLKKLIRRTKHLPVGTAISIAKQICSGLEEAHSHGIVHRDLKPNNIMIDDDGNARIMDFGIARTVKGEGLTGSGVVIGTPEYMSPEQIEAKAVDQRSDIYSLGIILFEMLTGQLPFEADTPLALGIKHKYEVPPDPQGLNPQIPNELRVAILKCLEKDRGNRFQKSSDLFLELESVEHRLPKTDHIISRKKPRTSQDITVQLNLKKYFLPIILALLILLIGLFIWSPWAKKEAVFSSDDKPSLAVLYFQNNTGEDSLDHLRTMLSNLLITDLTQSRHLRVLSENSLVGILDDLAQTDNRAYSNDVLREIALRGNVGYFLQGAFAKAGDEFRVNIILQDARNLENIDSQTVSGRGETSIFSLVDDLTPWIKTKFNLSAEEIASDIDQEIDHVTTSFPEAYRNYYEGRIWEFKGDYRKAIEYMEKAVAIDPEFAAAYLVMAYCYGNLRYPAEDRKYLDKALEHSERLTLKEKYEIQGNHFLKSETTYDQALEVLLEWTGIYPDDPAANNLLGILYSRLGESEKSLAAYEIAAKNSEDATIHVNLARAYHLLGMFDEAITTLEDYSAGRDEIMLIPQQKAFFYKQEGKLDLAFAEIEKAMRLNPTDSLSLQIRAELYFLKGETERSEKDYQQLLASSESPSQTAGQNGLYYLHLFMGQFSIAKELTWDLFAQAENSGSESRKRALWWRLSFLEGKMGNPAQALDYQKQRYESAVNADNFSLQRGSLISLGRIYLELGDLYNAREAAAKHRELVEKGHNLSLMRNTYHLLGWIELEQGNISAALDYLNRAIDMLDTVTTLYIPFAESLGLAYMAAEDWEKARDTFEKINSTFPGRLANADSYVLSFYRLGIIHEKLGTRAKAIENYEKFLDLWKDADPDLPEVEDAKSRLAGLRNN